MGWTTFGTLDAATRACCTLAERRDTGVVSAVLPSALTDANGEPDDEGDPDDDEELSDDPVNPHCACALCMTLTFSSRNMSDSWSRYPGHCFPARTHCEHSGRTLSHCEPVSTAMDGIRVQASIVSLMPMACRELRKRQVAGQAQGRSRGEGRGWESLPYDHPEARNTSKEIEVSVKAR